MKHALNAYNIFEALGFLKIIKLNGVNLQELLSCA
jgi:hypothetical protein